MLNIPPPFGVKKKKKKVEKDKFWRGISAFPAVKTQKCFFATAD